MHEVLHHLFEVGGRWIFNWVMWEVSKSLCFLGPHVVKYQLLIFPWNIKKKNKYLNIIPNNYSGSRVTSIPIINQHTSTNGKSWILLPFTHNILVLGLCWLVAAQVAPVKRSLVPYYDEGLLEPPLSFLGVKQDHSEIHFRETHMYFVAPRLKWL